jgi:site-specific DNA recombinase
MNNCILYERVSTDEQSEKGYSVEHQEITLKALCKIKNYNIVGEYKEDYSAKTFDRPEWKKIIQFIKSNKKFVNKILFTKWDRFSRNSYEAQGMIKELNKMGVQVECAEQPLDLDVPDNLLLLNIYLAVPEVENRKISIRTKDGMRTAALSGCWMSTPPFGYDRDRVKCGEKENATLKPNRDSSIVKEIFMLFVEEGLSAESIRKKIYTIYGKMFAKQNILNILTNISYLGKIKVKATPKEPEMIVIGLHPPIISDELFEEAQNVLKGKRRKHQRKDNREIFPLKEILKCNVCQLSHTASVTTKNKGQSQYPYYHCSKTKGHDRFPADIVHNTFELLLGEFKFKQEIIALYNEVIIDAINDFNKDITKEKQVIEKRIDEIRNQIMNMESKIANCTGDDSTYLSILSKLKNDENGLIMNHATLKAESTPKQSDLEYLLELFYSFDVLYKDSDYPVKKKLLSSIFTKPMYFSKNHFRTEEVSPLLELMLLNTNELQRLKIETSHLNGDSSTMAPPSGLEPETL